MAKQSVKDQIIRHLRATGDPACSAKQLAEHIDVSIPTINSHTEELIAEDRIATTRIGNATAYYLADTPTNRDHPEHTCKKCGRVTASHDFVKLDISTYFERSNREESLPDFYILCRFCHSDYISWIHNDPGMIGEYSKSHSWYIPDEQLEEIRDDPDTISAPTTEYLGDERKQLYRQIEQLEMDAGGDTVSESEIVEAASADGTPARVVRQHLADLHRMGHLWRRMELTEQTYRTAK